MVKKNKLLIFSILIFTILLGGIYALVVTQVLPTDTSLVTQDTEVNVSFDIHSDALLNTIFNFNGTNYSLINTKLFGWCNLDNRSELGDTTNLKCWSPNGGFNLSDLGVVLESTVCKEDNCMRFDGVNDVLSYSGINSIPNINFSYAVSFWVNMDQIRLHNGATDNVSTFVDFGYNYDYKGFRFYYAPGNWAIYSRTMAKSFVFNAVEDKWYNLIVNVDYGNMSVYKDGSYIGSVIGNFSNFNTNTSGWNYSNTLYFGAEAGTGKELNGTMDNIIIFNDSLTADEVSQLYKTQVTKYNSSYYQYNTTQTLYYTPIYYNLCATNLTGFETCTADSSALSVQQISANFSTKKGTLRNTAYGVSNHNGLLTNLSYITSAGGWTTFNTRSNADFIRNAFVNGNLNMFRSWAYLNVLSTGNITWNNTDIGSYYHASLSNIDAYIDQNKWAYENDKTMMIILETMPSWLANQSSALCTSSWSPNSPWVYGTTQPNWNYSACGPSDYDEYARLLVDFALVVSNNCQYADNIIFEVGNEMGDNKWLNALSSDNITKATEFIKLYNVSYDALKSVCDGRFVVGGMSDNRYMPNMYNTFLSNMTTKMDFYGVNIYSPGYKALMNTKFIDTEMAEIFTDCATYGANCSHVWITEWGYVFNQTEGYSSDFYKADLAYVYLSMFNKYPDNVSLAYHEYMMPVNDSAKTFISEQNGKANALYHPYNVTKNIASLCPAGSDVYVTSNTNDRIHQIACNKGSMYGIIILSNETQPVNMTLNLSLTNGSVFYPYTSIMNYETGSSIPVTGGVAQLGIIDSYEVLYLTSSESSLVNLFRLNEYTGSVVYDALFGTSNGTRSGATWVTDGVLRTLTSVTDFVFSGDGVLTLTSSNIFSYLLLNWDLSSVSVLRENFTAGVDVISGKIPLLFLVLIVGVILIVLGGLTALFYLLMKKVPSRFSGGV